MIGSPFEVIVMMKTMLPSDLIERIEKERNEMIKKTVVMQIDRMVCNKRVRDKEIAKNPNCHNIYRMMFFNHYSKFRLR